MFESSLELWANFGWNDLLNWRKEKTSFCTWPFVSFCRVFPRVSSLIKTSKGTGKRNIEFF